MDKCSLPLTLSQIDHVQKISKIYKIYQIYKICQNYKISRDRKRIWSREWLLRRNEKLGACDFVQNELRFEDDISFKNYLRMDKENFELLTSIIENKIKKQATYF